MKLINISNVDINVTVTNETTGEAEVKDFVLTPAYNATNPYPVGNNPAFTYKIFQQVSYKLFNNVSKIIKQ